MSIRRLRVGITSAGGDMVPSAIVSLRKNQQIAFDIHAFNAAFHPVSAHLADRFDILPAGDSPDYVSEVIRHVKENDIEVFLPWSDEEALALANARDALNDVGCIAMVSPPAIMNTITDKAKTYDILKKAGLKVPEYTVANSVEDIRSAVKAYGYPRRTIVVKPATGRGGRGVKILLGEDSPADWLGQGRREQRLKNIGADDFGADDFGGQTHGSYLVMPCLNAPVYDVDIFRFPGSETKCFVRERGNPTGIPFTGNSLRKDPEIEEYAHHIATVLNLQSLHDIDMMTDANLGPVLLEINPRPSGSLAGLSAAGFALLDYALAGVAGIQLDIKSVEEDVEILTYTESVALS
ncbi:ATP-grasp domain-containing protein [Alphaproteobacteria bacterium]|nr:ATP-grasp domain-containing protein [Alphaproteobacteria bacterium]